MVKRVCSIFVGVAVLLSCISAYAQTSRGTARVSASAVATAHNAGNSRDVPNVRQLVQQRLDAQRPAQKPAAASGATQGHIPFSPYEQFLQPTLQKLMAGQSRTLGRSALQSQSLPNGMHFPGFLQAYPVVRSGSDSDLSPVWASATADLNGDGMPDLVTIQRDGTLNVVLNPGRGKLGEMTLSSVNRSAVNSYADVTFVSVVDLDGDGYPDLVATDAGNNAIDVFLNRGDGTFGDATSYVVNFTAQYSWTPALYGGGVAVGDVNGDGAADLVVMALDNGYPDWSSSTFELFTFPGKGDGTFLSALPEQTAVFPGSLSTAGQMRLADVNKDGNLDLLFLAGGYDNNWNSAMFIAVVPGDGTGVFQDLPMALPATGAVIPNESSIMGMLSVLDVDGDNNPDLLFSDGRNNLYLSRGDGAGAFGTPENPINSLAGSPILNFADVTGDGKLDVIAYYNGSITVFPGEGDGAFSSTPLVQLVSGSGGDQQPMPADFDGDGNIDLVDVDYALNTAGFFLGGSGTFQGSPIVVPPGVGVQNFSAIAVADLNGDGTPDILGGQLGNAYQRLPDIAVALNDGHSHFTYSIAISNSTLENNYVRNMEPMAVDLNGDSKADLIFITRYGLSVVFGNGDGTFDTTFHSISLGTPTDINCSLNYADVGDLNHDGFPDIVVAYPGDNSCWGYNGNPAGVFTMLNNGDGTFTSSFTAIGSAPYLPKLIDFNGDGNFDLALADNDARDNLYNVFVVPGTDDGTFDVTNMSTPLANTMALSIIPGDFDGDGKQDLTVGVATQLGVDGQPIYNTTGVELLKGNGDFTFGLPTQYAAGSQPIDGKYADFNGDGRLDLTLNLAPMSLYTNVLSSGFAYLPNLGNGLFGPLQQTFSSPSQGGRLLVADFNGDGATDVLNQAGLGAQMFLNTGAITLTLAVDSANVSQGTAVTLTATLQPSVGTQTPTGTLTVFDNGTALETAAVNGTTTTLPLSDLAVGSHTLTASYSGDDHFNGASASTSVSVSVATLPPDVELAAPSPASLTLTQGATGTVVVPLAANATFSGTVQFSCDGVPAQATCTVSPASVSLAAGQSTSVTVVVATTAPNDSYQAASMSHNSPWRVRFSEFGMLSLAFVVWRKRRQIPRSLVVLGFAVMTFGLMGTLTGCGGNGSRTYQYEGTPAGSYTLTITATSGSVSHSQTVPLTIVKAQ